MFKLIHTAPYSTGPWDHRVVGTALGAAVLASSDWGSWGTAAAWRHWVFGTAPAGWGTGCLVHTAAHHTLAVDDNKYSTYREKS